MALTGAALGATILDVLPQNKTELLDKLRLMCCMNESSAVLEVQARLSPSLLADSEVQTELVRANWKCFCELPLGARVSKANVMWAVASLLSTSVSKYPSEEMDLQLGLLLKDFLVHAAVADVKEIALCAVAHAPWALKHFPTMQGEEMVVTKANFGRMSKEMLLHVFPYVLPNTLPIVTNEVSTAINETTLYSNFSTRRWLRNGSKLEALKLTPWGRKFTKTIEDQVGNISIFFANGDALVAIAKWMPSLLQYSDPAMLDDTTIVTNLCIEHPGCLEMVSESRRRDMAMIKTIARHPRFVAASSSFFDRFDGSKSIQILIDGHGGAINVTFSDLAGNQAYQPHQFPNGSMIKDLRDYISREEASCTRIALFDEAEGVHDDHAITAYRSLVAAIPLKAIHYDENGRRCVNGSESPHYVARVKNADSQDYQRARWYSYRRPLHYMAADKGDTAALLMYSHESLKSDADLVTFLAYNPDQRICYPRCLEVANDSLRGSLEFVKKLMGISLKFWKYAKLEHACDLDIAMELVELDPLNLQYFSFDPPVKYGPDWPADLKAIMLAAVETNGLALKYTGVMHGDEYTSTGPWARHQGSKDIAIAALKQNKSAAEYLYSRQKEEPEIKKLLNPDPVVAVSRRLVRKTKVKEFAHATAGVETQEGQPPPKRHKQR